MPYTATITVPLPEVHTAEKALSVASALSTAIKTVPGANVKDVSIKSTKGPR